VLQKISELLGLNPPIATGGSRSRSSQSVCMIIPRFQNVPGQVDLATAVADVPLANPTLLASEPFNEVRIKRNGTILSRRLASSSQAIEGPISWPLEPVSCATRSIGFGMPSGAAASPTRWRRCDGGSGLRHLWLPVSASMLALSGPRLNPPIHVLTKGLPSVGAEVKSLPPSQWST
jgi:hypothetical protein